MIPLSDPDLHSWRKPYVNYTLIGLCAIGFLYELGLGPSGRERFFFQYGLIPAALTQGSGASDIPAVATMITSMFLHGSISHFAFNMLFCGSSATMWRIGMGTSRTWRPTSVRASLLLLPRSE